MNNEQPCSCPNKYRREHSLSLENMIFTRRQFLERTGMGMGALSLASILGPAKAKAVIHIFAEGGPSQVDTWDPKE